MMAAMSVKVGNAGNKPVSIQPSITGPTAQGISPVQWH
jgi:hypothetical protein